MDMSDLENASSDTDEADGEVDPDSNDEGFYANDYPDEEDFDSPSDGFESDSRRYGDSSDSDAGGLDSD